MAAHLLTRLQPSIQASEGTFVLGLSGLQGSGKSTLAQALAEAAQARDLPTLVLSLDDYYLGRGDRRTLARKMHPLMITRGVPGTHDLDALIAAIDGINAISPAQPLIVPRFDKGRDTRLPRSRWRHQSQPPRLLIVEGWCLGVPAQTEAELDAPINTLEAEEDADGLWRHRVNLRLIDYQALWQRFDALAVLQAPNWSVVRHWRDEAEQAAREAGAKHAMDTEALARFIAHYERISRQALARLPALADLIVWLDAGRAPVVTLSRL
ncbi:kinase [Oleiagrimonas sp. C23AA]|nr:kinase [Oleiagrimonas sp. C23AA]